MSSVTIGLRVCQHTRPQHPASLPICVPSVERLPPALSRRLLAKSTWRFGYGWRHKPPSGTFHPDRPTPCRAHWHRPPVCVSHIQSSESVLHSTGSGGGFAVSHHQPSTLNHQHARPRAPYHPFPHPPLRRCKPPRNDVHPHTFDVHSRPLTRPRFPLDGFLVAAVCDCRHPVRCPAQVPSV